MERSGFWWVRLFLCTGDSEGWWQPVYISDTAKLVGEIAVLLGVVIPVIVSVHKIKNGMKCQLRTEMLQIYYHHRESKVIRQYDYENFVMLYEAYKALKGNSFIDKIYEEVHEWEIVTWKENSHEGKTD